MAGIARKKFRLLQSHNDPHPATRLSSLPRATHLAEFISTRPGASPWEGSSPTMRVSLPPSQPAPARHSGWLEPRELKSGPIALAERCPTVRLYLEHDQPPVVPNHPTTPPRIHPMARPASIPAFLRHYQCRSDVRMQLYLDPKHSSPTRALIFVIVTRRRDHVDHRRLREWAESSASEDFPLRNARPPGDPGRLCPVQRR